jgi:oligopeptide/dipeptide ABC transporter ATP-binding protein
MRSTEDVGGADDAIIDVRGLKTSFTTPLGTLKAVDGVSFSVGASEMLAIVGESGSGKSVTGLSIMRLFGRTGAQIDAGELRFNSRGGPVDLARLNEAEMARIRGQEIAIIFQDPMSSLNPVLTIGDQIGEGLRVHKGLSRGDARAAAIVLLARVGIPDATERVKAYPHQFSGGMRQRVMIAIALAANPRLLIADEPTTALDVTIQAQIVALLKALQRDTRMAMIFITHDLALVGDIADRVAVMYAGEIVETGPAQEVVDAPRHPYTRALIACMARHAPMQGGRRRPKPIPGALPDPYAPHGGCRFAPRCPLADTDCRVGAISLEETAPGRAVRCLKWRQVAA